MVHIPTVHAEQTYSRAVKLLPYCTARQADLNKIVSGQLYSSKAFSQFIFGYSEPYVIEVPIVKKGIAKKSVDGFTGKCWELYFGNWLVKRFPSQLALYLFVSAMVYAAWEMESGQIEIPELVKY